MENSKIIRLKKFLDSKKEFGVLLLRLLIGWRLIDGTLDNIVSWDRMIEFRDFLSHYNVPSPMLFANVSVYAQFFCGIFYIAGIFFRPAACVMVINFIVAFFIVHLGTSFQQSFEVLTMLSSSVFFLFHGPGKISAETYFRRRSHPNME